MHKDSDLYQKLYSKILNFVAYSPRTYNEVLSKLNLLLRKYSSISDEEKEWVKSTIISDLESLKLLNDQEYAFSYVKGKRESYSKAMMKAFLMKKGVSREIISEAISLQNIDLEFASALQTLEKKLKSLHINDQKLLKLKLSKYLISKGYSYDVIRTVVDTKFKVT